MKNNRISKVSSQEEKFEIDDWDSILSDFANFNQFKAAYEQVVVSPSLFQKNFGRMVSEVTGEVIRFLPYTYQHEYADDDDTQKIVTKSRQVGFTAEEAFIKYHKGRLKPNYSCFFYHLREENVKKYLHFVKDFNQCIVPKLRMRLVRDRDIFKQFDNGSKYAGLSSNALESGRGFTGDLVLDEFAIVSNSERLLASAGSISVRGFDLTMGSTPFGKHNEFHRLVKDCGWEVGLGGSEGI